MKALGAGAITAAGSLASGGGIAGEVGKRLTNQITNGTVRTATDMAAAVAKQALLGATQNAAGHVSDKAVEGDLPDANEPGKRAQTPPKTLLPKIQKNCRNRAAEAMLITMAGRKRNLIDATSVMPSAARSTGSVEAKYGAMTEISTQPGTASRITRSRGDSVRFRRARYPTMRVR